MSSWTCPVPSSGNPERVSLSVGEGARHWRRFLQQVIWKHLQSPPCVADAALVTADSLQIAICTDSHTVTPLFFPGGDLGSLSVFGTVNDLAVSGATPRWLTLSMIIEEGFEVVQLERILHSAATAARQCGVEIVAGDTKVVPRGAVDGLFLNTAGVGTIPIPPPSGPGSLRPNDQIMVSGPVGQHGMAILAARQNLQFDQPIRSDCGSVQKVVNAARQAGGQAVKGIRDATRGGVAAVLHEWAEACGLSIELKHALIPVSSQVRGACEILGLEPLHLANEGTIVLAVEPEYSERVLAALVTTGICPKSAIIGVIVPACGSSVTVNRGFGRPVPLDEPAGAPFPRIC